MQKKNNNAVPNEILWSSILLFLYWLFSIIQAHNDINHRGGFFFAFALITLIVGLIVAKIWDGRSWIRVLMSILIFLSLLLHVYALKISPIDFLAFLSLLFATLLSYSPRLDNFFK